MSPYDLVSGCWYDDVDALLGAYNIVGAPLAPPQRYGIPNQLAQAVAARSGQRGFPMQQGNPYAQQAIAQRMAQSGALLQQSFPSKARKQVLGMVSNGTIAAAGAATITARPQTYAFKPERIVIPATVGPDFTVQDIKVGNISQLVQSGDLPAEAFSQTSFGVEMDMDTVQTSQDFIMQVTNISGGARTFRAMILGRSANG